MTDCPHCKRFFRCPDCVRNTAEVALIADELAFWKYQAIWHRAWTIAGFREPHEADMKRAKAELERQRRDENRERYAHAEPPRVIGS